MQIVSMTLDLAKSFKSPSNWRIFVLMSVGKSFINPAEIDEVTTYCPLRYADERERGA